MLSKLKAGEALESLMGLEGFPANVVRRNQLLKAFQQADSAEIARRSISLWVSDSSRCPGPEEIRSIISELNVKHREETRIATAACIACGGSGFVEMRGINRFDGLVVTGAKPCVCRSMGQPVVIDKDACSMCGGHGLHGGHIGTNHDGPWEVCLCSAGRTEDAQRRVAEGNVARDKIIAAGDRILAKFRRIPSGPDRRGTPASPLQRVSQILSGYDEAYHGEF
jgi:hypothetical protein